MNAVFSVTVIVSLTALIFISPDEILPAFSKSAGAAAEISVKLLLTYVLWSGITGLITASGLNKKISKLFKPLISKLFGVKDEKTTDELSVNLSANLLGLGGVATPAAINAMSFMDETGNENGKNMLFIISATSIQILPLTVMGLMAEYGAKKPAAIILPTLIGTFLSTATGVILAKVFK